MKPYRITITPPGAPAYSYTGIFSHGCDAVTHALILLNGKAARISARRLL